MNDYEWKLTDPDDFLSHHGRQGQKWGQRNGPPYPLYRTGNYSSAQRKAAGKTGEKLVKRNDKPVRSGGSLSADNPVAKQSGRSATSNAGSSGSLKKQEVEYSRKTKKLQKKAESYAKSMHLTNDYNATRVKNSTDEEADSGENKDVNAFITNLTVNKLGAMKLYDMKLKAEESERKDAEDFAKKHANDKLSETNAGDSMSINAKVGKNEININKNDFSENWDKDNGPSSNQSNSSNNQPPAQNPGIQKQENVRQPSEHQYAYDVAHKKPVSMMTDKELADANNRLIAEQNLKKNRIATYSAGQKFLHDVGDQLYNQVLMPSIGNFASYETNKFMSAVMKTDWPSPKSNMKPPQNNNNGKNNNNNQNNNQNNNNDQQQKKKSPMDAT